MIDEIKSLIQCIKKKNHLIDILKGLQKHLQVLHILIQFTTRNLANQLSRCFPK